MQRIDGMGMGLGGEDDSSILISPRQAEEFIRTRGMKRSVTPALLAMLTAACVLPAPFVFWDYAPGGSVPGTWMLLIFTGYMLILATFLAVLCEFGSVFPYAGGAYTFARQETGVLGGYIAGMAVVQVHLCLASIALFRLTEVFAAGMAPGQAAVFYLVILLLGAMLAAYRTDYFFLALFALFCGGLAAAFLFLIAAWHSGLLNLDHLLLGRYFMTPHGLLILIFSFAGIAGIASVAEELGMRNRRWLWWVLPSFGLAAFLALLLIAVGQGGTQSLGKVAHSLQGVLLLYYPDDIVLRDTYQAFSVCAYLLPVYSGLYLVSRQIFAFARAGYLPIYYSRLLGGRQTPLRSIFLTGTLIFVLALGVNPAGMQAMVAFSFCLELMLVLYSWWRLEHQEPDLFGALSLAFSWLVVWVAVVIGVFFIILSIGQFTSLFFPMLVWFGLIMYVYYRGGSFIRDEAPDEAVALQKEKGKKVALK